jgi:aminoglycoside N3'-acetyltransferase
MDLFLAGDARHTDADLADVLGGFGLRGAPVMVVSSLLAFGRPAGAAVLSRVLEVLAECVGEEGTLVLPAYTFSAYKGEVFDPDASKGLGSLAEAARRGGGFLRTAHPVYSHLIRGAGAARLAEAPATTCFGPDSFFARFAAMAGARLLLLGGNLNMCTLWHLFDQRFEVPWRFVKRFEAEMKTPAGVEKVVFDSCVKRHEVFGERAACFDKLDVVARDASLLVRRRYAAGWIGSMLVADMERLFVAALGTDPDYFFFGTKEELDEYYFKNNADAARAGLDPSRSAAIHARLRR